MTGELESVVEYSSRELELFREEIAAHQRIIKTKRLTTDELEAHQRRIAQLERYLKQAGEKVSAATKA